MPETFPQIETVEFPKWAKPGPFPGVDRCVLAPGQRWPNGEPASGDLHPKGWATDPEVKPDGKGGFHMWLNWPDMRTGTTQIAYTHSEDGVRWTVPEVVLSDVGSPEIIGYETPSAQELPDGHGWVFAALVKRKDPDGRYDFIRLYHTGVADGQWEALPIELHPTLSWEDRWFNPRTGKMDGGLQEPALWLDAKSGALLMGYTASSYAHGNRPSTGLAWLAPGATTFQRWPNPIIENSGQIHLSEVVHEGDRGFLATYQDNPGSGGDVRIDCRFSRNLTSWSAPITICEKTPAGGPSAYRVVGPCLVGDRLWMWGQATKGGANSILAGRAAQ